MYYFFCIILYAALISYFFNKIKKPDKRKQAKFKKVLRKEAVKGITKSDVPNRNKRVKKLPQYQRFLYWLWFLSVMIVMLVLPVMLFDTLRNYVISRFFIPDNALLFELSFSSSFFYMIGGFFCGIPLSVVYSYLTNRGIIREADLKYQTGSFQEYPKEDNKFICLVLLLIFLPLMMINFNSYTYITEENIVVKTSFSISEKSFSYDDIDYIKRTHYSDGNISYVITFKNKKKIELSDKKVDMIMEQKNVEFIDEFLQPLL